MCKNKALEEYSGDSEWAAPTFGVPKKNDGVRIVTDFRKLNEAIKRNPWPMSTMQDMLHQCGGMTHATALDLIQSYCAMHIKKKHVKISGHHLTLGQIRIFEDSDGTKHLRRRLPTGTKPTLRRNAVCVRLHRRHSDHNKRNFRTELEILFKVSMQLNIDKSYFATI